MTRSLRNSPADRAGALSPGARSLGARTLGALVLSLAATTACAGGRGGGSSGAAASLNPQQVETSLLSTLHKERPDATIQAQCPTGVPLREAVTFECSVSLDGTAVSYNVTVADVHGASYDINSTPTDPIIDTTQVAASLTKELAATVPTAALNCGASRYVQVAVGKSFPCTVSADGQTSTLTVDVTDAAGDVQVAAGSP